MKINKEIKEKLKTCNIQLKWKNFSTWTKTNCNTLFDYVIKNDIKIIKKGDSGKCVISYEFGRMKVKYQSSIYNIEKDLLSIIEINTSYLGDSFQLKSMYRNVKKVKI